jgi:hypothetical protein
MRRNTLTLILRNNLATDGSNSIRIISGLVISGKCGSIAKTTNNHEKECKRIEMLGSWVLALHSKQDLLLACKDKPTFKMPIK